MVEVAIKDNILEAHELEGIRHCAERLQITSSFYSKETNEIQQFHGILGGISADVVISEGEQENLQTWINDHYHLKGSFPLDEIESMVSAVLADGIVTPEEHTLLSLKFSRNSKNSWPRPP